MTDDHDPLVQRDRLRALLRRAREAAGRTQKDAAEAHEWSLSKVVRIESGDVGVSATDLRALLSYYGVTDSHAVEAALELARTSRGSTAFYRFAEHLDPSFITFLAYERSAATIKTFHPSILPGLLQIEGYTRALLSGRGKNEDQIEMVWNSRVQRQQLHESQEPPRMEFLIDESAIHREVGGAGVLAKQLQHLSEMGARDHINIRLLPFSSGLIPSVEAMSILEFDGPDLNAVVYLESSDVTLRVDPRDTVDFLELAERIGDYVLSPDDSLAAIEAQIAKLSQRAPA